MRRNTLLMIIAGIVILSLTRCEKEDDENKIFMGKSFTGQSIPVDTKYSYSEGTYSAWLSFIDNKSYTWGQKNEQGEMEMVVPCEYNSTSGEFSDSMVASYGGNTYGAWRYFPTSFCIDDLQKMYLFTFDSQTDTVYGFPNSLAEKITGSEGTMVGTYKSVFKSSGWFSTDDGKAESMVEGEMNFTYTENSFNGTYVTKLSSESTLDIPEYGIEIGEMDSTETVLFAGSWEYNETDSTITETMTSPVDSTYIYKPYWVSYNDKLYMVTSLTRFYQKEN